LTPSQRRAQRAALIYINGLIRQCDAWCGFPLDNDLVDALTELHKRPLAESAAAGPYYRGGLIGLDWHRGGEYLATDHLGMPVIIVILAAAPINAASTLRVVLSPCCGDG
jgi:hypothetical protein